MYYEICARGAVTRKKLRVETFNTWKKALEAELEALFEKEKSDLLLMRDEFIASQDSEDEIEDDDSDTASCFDNSTSNDQTRSTPQSLIEVSQTTPSRDAIVDIINHNDGENYYRVDAPAFGRYTDGKFTRIFIAIFKSEMIEKGIHSFKAAITVDNYNWISGCGSKKPIDGYHVISSTLLGGRLIIAKIPVEIIDEAIADLGIVHSGGTINYTVIWRRNKLYVQGQNSRIPLSEYLLEF